MTNKNPLPNLRKAYYWMHDYIMPKTDNIISRWSFIKVSSKFQNRLAYVCVDNTTKVYIDEKKKNNCKTY